MRYELSESRSLNAKLNDAVEVPIHDLLLVFNSAVCFSSATFRDMMPQKGAT